MATSAVPQIRPAILMGLPRSQCHGRQTGRRVYTRRLLCLMTWLCPVEAPTHGVQMPACSSPAASESRLKFSEDGTCGTAAPSEKVSHSRKCVESRGLGLGWRQSLALDRVRWRKVARHVGKARHGAARRGEAAEGASMLCSSPPSHPGHVISFLICFFFHAISLTRDMRLLARIDTDSLVNGDVSRRRSAVLLNLDCSE